MKRLAKREMKKRKRKTFFKQDGSVETVDVFELNFEIVFFLVYCFIFSHGHSTICSTGLAPNIPLQTYKPTTHLVLTPLKSVFFTDENPARRIIQTYLQAQFFLSISTFIWIPLSRVFKGEAKKQTQTTTCAYQKNTRGTGGFFTNPS